MTGPGPPQRRTVQLGALLVALFVAVLVLAAGAQRRRWAWLDYPIPVHPAALAPVQRTHSRTFRWVVCSYPAAADATTLHGYYDEHLAAAGWQRVGQRPVGRGRVSSYRRDGWRLDLRTEPGEGAETLVRVMLTDVVTRSEEQAAGRLGQ